jgi:hypothetical protein
MSIRQAGPDEAVAAGSATRRIEAADIWCVAALVLWVAVLRAPFLFGLEMDADESVYTLATRMWREGGLLYRDVWDIKPPGFFAILTLFQAAFGDGSLGVRLPSLVAVAVTTSIAFMWLHRALGSRAIAFLAAACGPGYALAMNSFVTRAELVGSPFVMGGAALLFLGARPEVARTLAAGLLFGAAFTIKQSFAFEALAVGSAYALLMPRPQGFGTFAAHGAAFAAGLAGPFLGFLALFWLQGDARLLIDSALVGAARRNDIYPSLAESVAPLIINLRPMVLLAAVPLVLIVDRRRIPAGTERRFVLAAAAWLVGACASVAAQRAQYYHYLLVLHGPLVLMAGHLMKMVRHSDVATRLRRPLVAATLGALLSWPLGWFALHASLGGLPSSVVERTDRYLASIGLRSDDVVYLVDANTSIYVRSHLKPPTPYPAVMHLTCPFTLPVAQEDEMRRIMALRPRLVAFRFNDWLGCEVPERIALVMSAMGADYRRAVTLADVYDGVEIYCRLDTCPPDPAAGDPWEVRPPPPPSRRPPHYAAPRFDGGYVRPYDPTLRDRETWVQ